MNGTCQTPPSLIFRDGLVSVADLAVDGGFVYWTDVGADTVNRAPQSGGLTEVLASAQNKPLRLAFDETFVYWSSNLGGAIMKLRKTGGTPEVATPATQPWGLAVDADTIYWLEPNSEIKLKKAPKAGGATTSIFTNGLDSSTEVELDGAYLVRGDSRVVNAYSTEVWTTSPATGTTKLLSVAAGWAGDAERVFMSLCCNGHYGVKAVRLDGTAAAAIVDDGVGPTTWFGLDADFVYWYRDGRVRRAPKCGGPSQRYAIPIDQPRFRLAVDDHYVYWSTGTKIERLPK
jgi:hypothetical protein